MTDEDEDQRERVLAAVETLESWGWEVRQRPDGVVIARCSRSRKANPVRYGEPEVAVRKALVYDADRSVSYELATAVVNIFDEDFLDRPNERRCFALLLSRALRRSFPEAADALEVASSGAEMHRAGSEERDYGAADGGGSFHDLVEDDD